MSEQHELDELINNTYGTGDTPSHIVKRPKPFVCTIRLHPHDANDAAIEGIWAGWADEQKATSNAKAAIGMYHAAQRKDVGYFEDNHSWLVAEIQLAGRIEMQKQVDEQNEEIKQLRHMVNELKAKQNEHRAAMQVMYPVFAQIRGSLPFDMIVEAERKPSLVAGEGE